MSRIELLSPAGDLERLKIAVLYGADAVYIGGKKFSLRSRASNFDIDAIREGVEFAEAHGSHVHVTVNMIPHEDDLKGCDFKIEGIHLNEELVLKVAKDICDILNGKLDGNKVFDEYQRNYPELNITDGFMYKKTSLVKEGC